MKKSNIEDVPETIQEWYQSTNLSRKVLLFLCIAAMPVLLICFLINAEFESAVDVFEMLFSVIWLPGLLYGPIRWGWMFKWLWEKFKATLILAVPLFVLIVAFPLMGLMCTGSAFIIIDMIRFIKKKPLVYLWEAKTVAKI